MVTTSQYQATAAVTRIERRSEPRFKAGHSVVLRTSHAHPMEAQLMDVSSRGARVRVPEAIPVDEPVRIETPGLLLFGTVKRCVLVHGAHEVGVALALPVEMLGELEKLNSAISAEA
jgi:hypothetical protein